MANRRGKEDIERLLILLHLLMFEGQTQILSVSAKAAYGYDAETGKEIWQMTHGNFNAAVRPVYVPEHKIAIINTGSAKASIHGILLSKSTKGKIDDSKHIKWSQRRASRYCLPIYFKDHVYQITHDGFISCIDIKTGETKWKESTVSSFIASPILVGKNIYITDAYGKTTIFEANPTKYTKIAENEIDEEVSSCPAVAEGDLFIRGTKHLYKISQ